MIHSRSKFTMAGVRSFVPCVLIIGLVLSLTSVHDVCHAMDSRVRIGLLEAPQPLNPIGLHGALHASSWNQIATDGWFLSLAGPIGPYRNYLPVSSSILTTQDHMRREFNPESGSFTRFVTATVPLRRDLFWSDGTPLRAEDVVFTYQVLQQLNVRSLGGNWPVLFPDGLLYAVEALDAHTVKFWLTRVPGLGEWQFGLLAVPLMNKTAWESHFLDALQHSEPARNFARLPMLPVVLGPSMPASNGSRPNPYDVRLYERIVVFESETAAVSNARSHFEFRPPNAGGTVAHVIEASGPPPYRTFHHFKTRSDARQALERGDIDVLPDPLNDGTGHGIGLRVLAFNLRRTQTADASFRRALNEIIDREGLIKFIQVQTNVTGSGRIAATSSLVPPTLTQWHNPFVGHPGPPLSPQLRHIRAKTLLEQAEYQATTPLTIVTLASAADPVAYFIARYVANTLAELDILSEVIPLSRTEFYSRVFEQRDFDLVIAGWRVEGTTFPHHLVALFTPASNVWNISGYHNPEYEKTARQLMSATDLATARRVAYELQNLLYQDAPVIPLISIESAPTPSPVSSAQTVPSALLPRHNTIWWD